MAEAKKWQPQPDGCLDIGRIANIRSDIDQGFTISKLLKLKMNVVDLIPCNFDVDYSSMLKFEDNKLKIDFSPEIKYKKPVANYISACTSYGLRGYEFLRLHLTDISTVSDDMSNEYTKSIIDDAFNSVTSSRVGQLFQNFNKAKEAMGKSEAGNVGFSDHLKVLGLNENSSAVVDLAANIITHGSRVAFPKIWSNNSYSPNLNCVIKLVSPYGHPKAVNEFIIKPLSYLMILFSPSTSEGLITHRPSYFTLKSYGLSNLTLCYLSQLNIRRGGDDSSYNSFNQPLTVEISLTFNSVTEGFACFAEGSSSSTSQHKEKDILKGEDSIALKTFEDDFDQPNALFPTLKSMINSFRPYKYVAKSQSTESVSNLTSQTSSQVSTQVSGGVINELPREELIFSSKLVTTTFDAISSVDISVSDETIVVFTPVDSNSSIFEFQIITDSDITQTKVIDINNFTSDSDIEYLKKTEDGNIVIKFKSSTVSKVMKIRNITVDILGMWSEDIIVNNNEDIINLSTSIIPSYKGYTENIRWQLIDDKNNTYGPYMGFPENGKSIPNNDYNLQVLDLTGDIKYEENITISDNKLIKQIVLNETHSNLKTTFNIPQDYNIDDFSYYLISDFDETSLVECYNNQENTFVNGKYYYLVKYKDQIIPKLNSDIDTSIIIDQDIVQKTININNDLKIVSVVS